MPDTINKIAPQLDKRAPLDALLPLAGNPRKGDHATIRTILSSTGQVEPLVVNVGTLTGRANEILGGNNRYQVMRALGWTEAGVTYVDVDDIAARKIAAQLNRAGDMATYDQRALADFLASIAAESDLLATGYTDEAYNDLARATDIYGDAASGFLDGYTDPNPDDDGDAPTARRKPPPSAEPDEDPQIPAYVTVSWTVLPEDREVIRKTITHALNRWHAGTGASALVMICDDYNRTNKL